MKRLLTLLMVVLCTLAVSGKDKERAWQQGKLADIVHGARSETGTGLFTPNASTRIDVWTITIDSGGRRYVAEGEHTRGELGSHGFKDLQIEVNDGVQFAVEKDNLFVLGSDKKERRLKIIKIVKQDPDAKGIGKQ